MNARPGITGQWMKFHLGEIFGAICNNCPDGVGVEVEVGDQSQGVGNGSHD